ncbi:hypothetical protein BDV93DRAFT_75890 [Ceratobasidium sp. AG-I]|nr:hypothetical protein BDV93DRAFT_75890 [Ceratobasidium sp. AG-I]
MLFSVRAALLAGLAVLAAPSLVAAQGTSSNTNSQLSGTPVSGTNASTNTVPSPTVTFTDVATAIPVLTTQTVSRSISSIQTLSSVATVIRVSYTLTASSSTSASAASASPTETTIPSIHLDTRVDPTFGVLGALLILTGLPTAFWGHKNRWSSFFLIGFYTLSLTTIVLILKFGVLDAINPPKSTVRGMFLLASAVAGIVGGGLSIFFWKHTKYFIGAWGGFALALWIQCFKAGGLIQQVGYRWIFYVGCAVLGFVLCTIPRIHYNVLLVATAVVGGSATILGVDCFTTAGLKEFYVWNLGFMRLFPKFYEIGMAYPLSQTMQIELGLIAAVALMGGAVQFKMLERLKTRLHEIDVEQRKRDEDAEIAAAERLGAFDEQLDDWEKRHGRRAGAGAGSAKEVDSSLGPQTPTAMTYDGRPSSQFSALNGKGTPGTPGPAPGTRLSDYFAVPLRSPKPAVVMPEPAHAGISGRPQSIGALPVLDLGTDDLAGGAGGVRRDSIARMEDAVKANEDAAAIRRKEELLAEIQTIKKNIAQLKSEGVSNSSGSGGSRASMMLLDSEGSRSRTVSFDALRKPTVVQAPPPPPPQETEWDQYVRERKLFTPPSGVTAPIPSGTMNGRPVSAALPGAVMEAVEMRKRRESMLEMGRVDEDEVGVVAPVAKHARSRSVGTAQLDFTRGQDSHMGMESTRGRDRPSHSRQASQQSQGGPVLVAPPRKSMSPAPAPSQAKPRVKTWEEMQERHREKMRALQEPLRKAEAELAELETARSRWERSRQVEKQVMERREAEKKAAYEKRKAEAAGVAKEKQGAGKRLSRLFGGASQPVPAPAPEPEVEEEALPRASRGSGMRESAAVKVAAWQAYQEQEQAHRRTPEARRSGQERQSRRQSTGPILPQGQQPYGRTSRRSAAPN